MGKKCCVTGCRSGYAKKGSEAVKATTTLPETAASAVGSTTGGSGSGTQESATEGETDDKDADADSAPSGSSAFEPSGSLTIVQEGHISFHAFPEDAELRRHWIRAIPREN